MYTLVPAFGRDYKTAAQAREAFFDNVGFMIASAGQDMGRYCNLRDLLKYHKGQDLSVTLRYNNRADFVIIDLNALISERFANLKDKGDFNMTQKVVPQTRPAGKPSPPAQLSPEAMLEFFNNNPDAASDFLAQLTDVVEQQQAGPIFEAIEQEKWAGVLPPQRLIKVHTSKNRSAKISQTVFLTMLINHDEAIAFAQEYGLIDADGALIDAEAEEEEEDEEQVPISHSRTPVSRTAARLAR